nr:reverse transcriptase domain-containing protein [Tanacetum cinerariifolium]
MSASIEACIARHAALLLPPLPGPSPPLPLPSPLTTNPTDIGAPLGYRAVKIRIRALLPSTSRRTDILEADVPPRKRACLTTLALGFKIGESSVAGATRQLGPTKSDLRRCRGVDQRVTELDITIRKRTDEFEVIHAREAWACSKDRSAAIAAHVRTLEAQVAALIAQTSSLQNQLTTTLGRIDILEARDPEPQEGPAKADSRRSTRATPATITTPTTTVTDAQIQALIDGGVAAALAEHDVDRSRNGDNSNDSGTGERRQFKFASCTLQGSVLTWWIFHMRAIGQDVAYAIPWAALKRMITDKYYPRGEIQKLESEYWNLKVKGLDLLNYNQRF